MSAPKVTKLEVKDPKDPKKHISILEVVELGQSVLREEAKPVRDVMDPKLQDFFELMIATTLSYHGVGLAAPQVGMPLRIFIMAPEPNFRYPNETLADGLVIINPTIIRKSNKTESDWEGCLSIPGIRGMVPRSTELEVEFTTRLGNKKREVFKGFDARIFQHEFDHLNGTVFLDRLRSVKDIITDREYHKLFEKDGKELE